MMAYCPECGSEVAPNNTFCAYCGIALTPVPTVEETPVQPEIPAPIEPQSEFLPVIPAENKEVSLAEPAKDPEFKSDNPIPPTPFILENENFIPPQESESFAGKHNDHELRNDTLENFSETLESLPMQTDASSYKEIVKKDEVLTENPNSLANDSNEELANTIETFDVEIPEEPKFEDSTAVEIPIENQFLPQSEKKPFDLVPIEIPLTTENAVVTENPIEEKQNLVSEPAPNLSAIASDPDFSETIPYTPNNYFGNSAEQGKVDKSAFENTDEYEKPQINDQLIVAQDEENKSTEMFSSEEFVKSLEFENKPEYFENNSFPINESLNNSVAEPVNNFGQIPPSKELDSENLLGLGHSKNLEAIDPPTLESTPVTSLVINQPFEEPLIELPVNQEVPVVETPNIEQPVEAESKENRPFTNHNIGVIDTDGNKSAKLKPIEEGTVLNGRYEIVRKIGGGGMGAVYLANDRNLGGISRAVKEMIQSSIEDEQQEKAISDFKRESTILSALEHPAIPTIFDYFFDEKEGRFYLVMKYISGGDLAARLRSSPEGKIDEATITDWGIQLADVLHYLHKQDPQIVYRDLKPSNIMIDGNTGRIMLIDFGIARLINSDNADVTAVGTMGYAPPELYRKNVEPRSDIFSLGSTMFHLLTGADPQSNPLLIFDFNKNPRPRQINSLISDQMEQILMRAVELDAANRFSSAAEMRDALKLHLDNLLKGAVSHGVISTSSKAIPASNLPVFCGFCGQKIVATDQFCPFCGSLQPTAGQSSKLQQTPIYAAPKATARVLVVGTNDLGSPEFSLDKDSNLVGRRDPMSNIFPEVDLSKYDPQTKISRKHARIWRENETYMLEDLGSSNGTMLMSPIKDSVRLLPRQPHVLANGDKIKVGDTTLHFFVG